MFQRLRGLPPTAGLDGFPLDRVVEMHVAGGAPVDVDGLALVDDAHGPEPLPDTWQIVEAVLPRAHRRCAPSSTSARRTRPTRCVGNFRRLNRMFPS